MDKILVSILVPVYNTSEFLEKCLDSLIGQTLKEIEIICVNDGSTDNSLKILKKYQKKDSRIIVVDKKNGGLPSARNAAIDVAKGEYLGFVDSDDYVKPNMFEKMYQTAIKQNSEVVVCGAEIFPDNPKASPWLYDVLSPREAYYSTFSADILFKERGARPFIWRNLIKRDLIYRNNFRLDESIILGEDQAFQFKVFPKAKGISFIPDKLYYYCWWRPGSIMNGELYHKINLRVEKHLYLCEKVIEQSKLDGLSDVAREELLLWSVELLYNDFIKLSLEKRCELAKRITSAWNDLGYWKHHNRFQVHINDMFNYFYLIANVKDAKKPDVSLVVNLYNCKYYFEEFREFVNKQSMKNIEIIFINNACNDGTYGLLHKWLTEDERVRVVNQEYSSIAKTFDMGMHIAVGKAVVFADAHDLLRNENILKDYYDNLIKSKAQISCSKNLFYDNDEKSTTGYKIYDFMYDREFLIDSKLRFEEFASLTTRNFACEALAKATKISIVSEGQLFKYRPLWHRDWLYTDEANKLLAAYKNMLSLTKEYGYSQQHIDLIDEINSDKVIQQILNATLPYIMPAKQCPDGENSQHETFKLLLEINENVDREQLPPYQQGSLKIIREFVDRRHKFLMKF